MKETTLSVTYDFGNRRTVTKRGDFDDHLNYLAGLNREEIAGLSLVNREVDLDTDQRFLLQNLRAILAPYKQTGSGVREEMPGECMCSMEYSPCFCPKENMKLDDQNGRELNEFLTILESVKHALQAETAKPGKTVWSDDLNEEWDFHARNREIEMEDFNESREDSCNCEEDGFCFHDDVGDECDCDFGCENCEPAPVMSNEPNVNILSDADNIRRIARNRILEDLRDKINDHLAAESFNPVVTFRAGIWLSEVLFEKGYDHFVRNTDEEEAMEYDIYLAGFGD